MRPPVTLHKGFWIIPGRVFFDVGYLGTYKGIKAKRFTHSIGNGRSCWRRAFRFMGCLVIVGKIIEGEDPSKKKLHLSGKV